MDLFVVPTIGFELLYAFVIVRLDRRDLIWIDVTRHPTAEWIACQITEAFPWNEAPRYLIRDRDRIFGAIVTRRLRAMGIRDKPNAPASPWQNAFAERLIGSIRRECVDHIIVLGEAQPAPDPAMLCALLQRNQNPSGAEQGCAALSRRSASWNHQITRNPRRTSSPKRPDLAFATHGSFDRWRFRESSRMSIWGRAQTSYACLMFLLKAVQLTQKKGPARLRTGV